MTLSLSIYLSDFYSPQLILIEENLVDKLSPIFVSTSWELLGLPSSISSSSSSSSSLAGHPDAILSELSLKSIEASTSISKDCGVDGVCIPDLAVDALLEDQFHVFDSDKEIVIKVSVENRKV